MEGALPLIPSQHGLKQYHRIQLVFPTVCPLIIPAGARPARAYPGTGGGPSGLVEGPAHRTARPDTQHIIQTLVGASLLLRPPIRGLLLSGLFLVCDLLVRRGLCLGSRAAPHGVLAH